MIKDREIIGTVHYQDIETGFWGVIDHEGNRWQPFPMPQLLQKDGLRVRLWIQEITQVSSMLMWGRTARLKKYEIL